MTKYEMENEYINFLNYCKTGDLRQIKKLVRNGYDITFLHTNGFVNALMYRNLNIIKYYKDQRKIPFITDWMFKVAIWSRNLEIIKILINHGGKSHIRDWAFNYALSNKFEDVVQLFIKKHILFNDMLDSAIIIKNSKIVSILREKDKGKRWNCYNCIIKSTCMELCENWRK